MLILLRHGAYVTSILPDVFSVTLTHAQNFFWSILHDCILDLKRSFYFYFYFLYLGKPSCLFLASRSCKKDFILLSLNMMLSYHPLSNHILSHPPLSQPDLSNPPLSNPILSYPILPYPILSYPILPYPIQSYLIPSWLIVLLCLQTYLTLLTIYLSPFISIFNLCILSIYYSF